MDSTTKKWLTGCGIGCGVVLLIVVGLGLASYFMLRNTVDEIQQVEAGSQQLEDRYGLIRDFTPPVDGSLEAERIEAFLSVREGLGDARTKIEEGFARLDAAESGRGMGSPGNIFKAIKAGMGLLPEVFAYLERRNDLLLEADMGLGEYIHFYCVSYYILLEKSPGDGPGFVVLGDDDQKDNDMDDAEVRKWRDRRIRRFLNSRVGAMLRNQRAALRGSSRGEELASMAQRLDAEIDALDENSLRLPWHGGLPDATMASLRPYRDRLEATYGEFSNCMDLGPSGQE